METAKERLLVSGTRKVCYDQIGSHANAWQLASVSANGTSASLDKEGAGLVTAFGDAGGATTITIQVSQDGAQWYDSGANQVLAALGAFHINLTTAARYVRLKSSAAVTITATIVAQ